MLKKGTKISALRKIIKRKMGKYAVAAVILCGLAGTGQFSFCAEAAQDAAEPLESEITEASEDGNVGAPEVSEQGMILEAEKRIEMKAAPEKTAETLVNFQPGSLLFAAGETADGWYRVVYQGIEGYVEKDGLTVLEMDIEGLDAEMAVNEAETKFVVEVVEKYRADARRSKIWGTVIIVLVAGIFGIGIYSAVRTKQDGEDGKNDDKIGEKNREKGRKDSFRKKKLNQMEIEDLN